MKTLSLLMILAVCGSASWCSTGRQRVGSDPSEVAPFASVHKKLRRTHSAPGRLIALPPEAPAWPISANGIGRNVAPLEEFLFFPFEWLTQARQKLVQKGARKDQTLRTRLQLPLPPRLLSSQEVHPYTTEELEALDPPIYDWNRTLEERLTASEKLLTRSPEWFALYRRYCAWALEVVETPRCTLLGGFDAIEEAARAFLYTMFPAHWEDERAELYGLLDNLNCDTDCVFQLESMALAAVTRNEERLQTLKPLWARIMWGRFLCEMCCLHTGHHPLDCVFRYFYRSYHAKHSASRR